MASIEKVKRTKKQDEIVPLFGMEPLHYPGSIVQKTLSIQQAGKPLPRK